MTQISPLANAATANAIAATDKTLFDMTASSGFATLHDAIKIAGLKDLLKAEGPYTLFAPTDAAFAKLPPGTLDTLMKSENKDRLVAVLKNHVVSGRYQNKDVSFSSEAQTLDGNAARLTDYVDLTASRSDTACCNGVIHSIDRVVLPN